MLRPWTLTGDGSRFCFFARAAAFLCGLAQLFSDGHVRPPLLSPAHLASFLRLFGIAIITSAYTVNQASYAVNSRVMVSFVWIQVWSNLINVPLCWCEDGHSHVVYPAFLGRFAAEQRRLVACGANHRSEINRKSKTPDGVT
jgi:hypothetical protein